MKHFKNGKWSSGLSMHSKDVQTISCLLLNSVVKLGDCSEPFQTFGENVNLHAVISQNKYWFILSLSLYIYIYIFDFAINSSIRYSMAASWRSTTSCWIMRCNVRNQNFPSKHREMQVLVTRQPRPLPNNAFQGCAAHVELTWEDCGILGSQNGNLKS